MPSETHRWRRIGWLLAGAAVIVALVIPAATADAAPKRANQAHVTVMTRNVAIGADLADLMPWFWGSGDGQELSNLAGEFLQQVESDEVSDFATRAKGLAAEIRRRRPDLVGLQEVARWRTAPCGPGWFQPKAETNRLNYLSLLLERLNRGDTHYRPVAVEPEFDFEVPANLDGDEGTGTNLGAIEGCDANLRWTLRDVILARRGVKATAPAGGHFAHAQYFGVGDVPVEVTRGWTRVDAKVEGAPRFRFVNTQLEEFGFGTVGEDTRALQAGELVAPGGPATGGLPVILVGDLNSDLRTQVDPGDAQAAYQALVDAGFRPRSTWEPLSCCITAYPILTEDGGGDVGQFDHKTDHVMTDAPGRVKLVRSSLTGRQPVNGFWSSDHAGVVSTLKFRQRP